MAHEERLQQLQEDHSTQLEAHIYEHQAKLAAQEKVTKRWHPLVGEDRWDGARGQACLMFSECVCTETCTSCFECFEVCVVNRTHGDAIPTECLRCRGDKLLFVCVCVCFRAQEASVRVSELEEAKAGQADLVELEREKVRVLLLTVVRYCFPSANTPFAFWFMCLNQG